MAYSIKLAGQDITLFVDQASVEIDDTLGQGGGAGSSGSTQGRAATIKMNTSLGPMNSATGAGIFSPPLIDYDTFIHPDRVETGGVIYTGWYGTNFGLLNYGYLEQDNGFGSTFTQSNQGYIKSNGADLVMIPQSTVLAAGGPDLDTTAVVTINNSGDIAGLCSRVTYTGSFSTWSAYKFLYFSNSVHINKTVAGSNTSLVTSTAFTMTPGTPYNMRFLVAGNSLFGKIWQFGSTEPIAWNVNITDTALPGTAYGTNNVALLGNTAGPSIGVGFSSLQINKYTNSGLLGTPQIVRQGEIIVTDTNNQVIYGGYITKYTDTTTAVLGQTKQNFTTLEGIDYSTHLQRTFINENFSGLTDVQIITFIINKYAPWVSLVQMPAIGTYQFPNKLMRNVSVEQAIQTIAGVTGFLVYVDYLKVLHYLPPVFAASAPFNLSDTPDFTTTFPHFVEEFLTDDNSIINRVYFSGGTSLSNDFLQDISTQANGSNTTFVMAYFPSHAADGKYHVYINGTELALGNANGSATSDTLIHNGGSAQVLIDPGSKTLTFDVAPTGGQAVTTKYRYSFPLSMILTDETSHKFFGSYLDGKLDDNTIFDTPTAIQRCKVLLSQQSFGLTTLKLAFYNKPGIQSGMVVHVKNGLRGILGSYLVQQVTIDPLGGGNFIYHLTLGAWNWNIIDFLLKIPTLAAFQDDNADETTEFLVVNVTQSNVQVRDAWTVAARTPSNYLARAVKVGDGRDAFSGLSTVA